MKILITGATGLIGKSIIQVLLSKNHKVNFLTTSKSKLNSIDHANGYLWNPNSQDIDENALEGIDCIINLAGATISKRWTKSYKEEILKSRLDSIETLRLGLIKTQTKLQTIVSASAIGIYPNSLTNYYSEDFKVTNEEFLGRVVKKWEKSAASLASYTRNLSLVRIGLVMHKDSGALPKMTAPIKSYLGASFGAGEQWQSWIHHRDLARIFVFLLENNYGGVFNAVAPNPVKQNKMIQEIARLQNKPLWLPNIPEFVMRLILGDMTTLLFDSQRVCSKKIQDLGFTFDYPNISGALSEIFGFEKFTSPNVQAQEW